MTRPLPRHLSPAGHPRVVCALLVVGSLSIGMLAGAGLQVANPAPIALPPVTVTPGDRDACEAPYSCMDDGTPVPGAGIDPFGTSWEDQRFIGRGDPIRRERGFRYS